MKTDEDGEKIAVKLHFSRVDCNRKI